MIRMRLFRRKHIWWPTRYGWLVLSVGILFSVLLICWRAEQFLAVTNRVPANVLVVEGWIGQDALQAAAEEFRKERYDLVVAAGGYTSRYWGNERYSYAEIAARMLRQAGVPADRILLAQAPDAIEQRTYASAAAARKVLSDRGIILAGINVFTRSTHARRSCLVNHKLQTVPVGVIGWVPQQDRQTVWWHSSERTKDLLAESCSYIFEAMFNSGRLSNGVGDSAVLTFAASPAE